MPDLIGKARNFFSTTRILHKTKGITYFDRGGMERFQIPGLSYGQAKAMGAVALWKLRLFALFCAILLKIRRWSINIRRIFILTRRIFKEIRRVFSEIRQIFEAIRRVS